jgi:hypothetical protein
MADIIKFQGGGTYLNVYDEATPYLGHLAKTFPKEFSKALKSLAWHHTWNRANPNSLVNELKKGKPGGNRYPKLTNIKRPRSGGFRKRLGARGQKYLKPLPPKKNDIPYAPNLINAIGYDSSRAREHVVTIGWRSSNAKRFGAAMQMGARGAKYQWRQGPQKITPRMRRFLFAMGFYVTGDYLVTPKRQVILPYYRKYKGHMVEYIEEKTSFWVRRSLKRSIRYHSAKAIMGKTPAFRRYVRHAA